MLLREQNLGSSLSRKKKKVRVLETNTRNLFQTEIFIIDAFFTYFTNILAHTLYCKNHDMKYFVENPGKYLTNSAGTLGI